MKYKNIDHVVITTQNLDACLHFYVDILDMKLDKSSAFSATSLAKRSGGR